MPKAKSRESDGTSNDVFILKQSFHRLSKRLLFIETFLTTKFGYEFTNQEQNISSSGRKLQFQKTLKNEVRIVESFRNATFGYHQETSSLQTSYVDDNPPAPPGIVKIEFEEGQQNFYDTVESLADFIPEVEIHPEVVTTNDFTFQDNTGLNPITPHSSYSNHNPPDDPGCSVSNGSESDPDYRITQEDPDYSACDNGSDDSDGDKLMNPTRSRKRVESLEQKPALSIVPCTLPFESDPLNSKNEEGKAIEWLNRCPIKKTTVSGVVEASKAQKGSRVQNPPSFPKCPVCNKEFTGRYAKKNAKTHLETHSDERKYACPHCPATFRQNRPLRVHVNIVHLKLKPFSCRFCEKKFSKRDHIAQHERSHTGEKPFVCDICGAAFAVPETLKSHKYQHTDSKDFLCSDCGKSFRTPARLKMHIRTVHQPPVGDDGQRLRTIKCTLCPSTFYHQMGFRVHLRKYHGVKVNRL